VPDAVLVGGSAAALWANHGSSQDHDHVLADLTERFDAVLEAIEATDGWSLTGSLPDPYGTTELLQGGVARARKLAAESERGEVAAEVSGLVGRSGLSQQAFAERIGTSGSRLSTYMSGRVVPSAALMVRMRRVARSAA